ncbi:putative methyltransferase [Caballeronia turbans]|nr:putative methyltransferase [Caballeronia turbans]
MNAKTFPPGTLDPASVKIYEPTSERTSTNGWDCVRLIEKATPDRFNEEGYLAFNPDVRSDVEERNFRSGLDHFCKIGHTQNRKMVFHRIDLIREEKRKKLERFKDVFLPGLPVNERTLALDTVGDAVPDELPISAWGYNPDLFEAIEKHRGGVIVDLGAGFRPEYYPDIINLELGNFVTTDVRSFAEKLPFRDNSVDCIFSLAVLEHVMRPWDVAKEIERVLKPGGTLRIDTAFMAARHGYPNHYYNMTVEGLTNLFSQIDVESSGASIFGHAAYSLYWVSRIYRDGLPPQHRDKFSDMTIRELLSYSDPYYLLQDRTWLREIPKNVNDDIAFNVAMTGTKRKP